MRGVSMALAAQGHVRQLHLQLQFGVGVSVSKCVAAFCACNDSALEASASALQMAKRASEMAAQQSKGPGSFHPAYLDALYQIAREHV